MRNGAGGFICRWKSQACLRVSCNSFTVVTAGKYTGGSKNLLWPFLTTRTYHESTS